MPSFYTYPCHSEASERAGSYQDQPCQVFLKPFATADVILAVPEEAYYNFDVFRQIPPISLLHPMLRRSVRRPRS